MFFEQIAMRMFCCRQSKLSPALFIIGVGITLTNASAVVIDDFSQGPAILTPTNYSPGLVILQTGLNTNSIIGGTRKLTARSSDQALLEVDAVEGQFSFEAVNDYGYFWVRYGSETNLNIDLRADGSEAFLLTFSGVDPQGPGTGRYIFYVNGVPYGFIDELGAINGVGSVRIPFSKFSNTPTFIANTIELEASRVRSGYWLILDSIETVNADTPPRLKIVTLGTNEIQLEWSTNATGFVMEKRQDISVDGWETVTNSVDVSGGQFLITVDTPETTGYFRLRRE